MRTPRPMHGLILLFAIFSATMLAFGVANYNMTSSTLKAQLTARSRSLAVAAKEIITEDSNGYAAFIKNINTNTEYYRRVKSLMMRLENSDAGHTVHIHTEMRIDAGHVMYLVDGEEHSALAPGTIRDEPAVPTEMHMDAGHVMPERDSSFWTWMRFIEGNELPELALGTIHDEPAVHGGYAAADSTYMRGGRIRVYEPILHKTTGEFLGLVGAEVAESEYDKVMHTFFVQTAAIFLVGFSALALSAKHFSGGIHFAVNSDGFTGLPNKTFFKRELEDRLKRDSASTYVIMADLDHFKTLNDTYGHEFADKILRAACARMTAAVRKGDIVARYGGDEFSIILSCNDATTALEVMERIRMSVGRTPMHEQETGEDVHVTVSLGGTKPLAGISADLAVGLADKALYIAKRERNACVLL